MNSIDVSSLGFWVVIGVIAIGMLVLLYLLVRLVVWLGVSAVRFIYDVRRVLGIFLFALGLASIASVFLIQHDQVQNASESFIAARIAPFSFMLGELFTESVNFWNSYRIEVSIGLLSVGLLFLMTQKLLRVIAGVVALIILVILLVASPATFFALVVGGGAVVVCLFLLWIPVSAVDEMVRIDRKRIEQGLPPKFEPFFDRNNPYSPFHRK